MKRKATMKRSLLGAITASLVLFGCTAQGVDESPDDIDDISSSVSDVPQSPVKRQYIGNCWLYATAGWAESLHLSATGKVLNLSETYWTYWDWYRTILDGNIEAITRDDIGGFFSEAAEIIATYGLMLETDFVPGETDISGAERQQRALAAIRAALTKKPAQPSKDELIAQVAGKLATKKARSNPELVRATLNEAFQLSKNVAANLAKVFEAKTAHHRSVDTLDPSVVESASILRSKEFKIQYKAGPFSRARASTLDRILPPKGSDQAPQDGANYWHRVAYPGAAEIADKATRARERRRLQIRAQRALHDEQPVLIEWYVANGGGDSEGAYRQAPAVFQGGGGHLSIVHDYGVKLPNGEELPVGVDLVEQFNRNMIKGDLVQAFRLWAKLNAALDDDAKLVMFRIKNSWGLGGNSLPSLPGYYDLYREYLDNDAIVLQGLGCTPEQYDWEDCSGAPLQAFVLPPGY